MCVLSHIGPLLHFSKETMAERVRTAELRQRKAVQPTALPETEVKAAVTESNHAISNPNTEPDVQARAERTIGNWPSFDDAVTDAAQAWAQAQAEAEAQAKVDAEAAAAQVRADAEVQAVAAQVQVQAHAEADAHVVSDTTPPRRNARGTLAQDRVCRGSCGGCGLGVYTDQPRTAAADAKQTYWHDACLKSGDEQMPTSNAGMEPSEAVSSKTPAEAPEVATSSSDEKKEELAEVSGNIKPHPQDAPTAYDKTNTAVKVPVTTDSALVPVTVPDLPTVVLDRVEVQQNIVGALLGITKGELNPTISLSTAVTKKVAIQGQGGVGKTTMSTVVARNVQVRATFERMAWISVGQTPDVMELQRILFAQLTGTSLEASPAATAALQLDKLREACVGKRWLLVLDDVWDSAHEKLLNCIDDSTTSTSRLLVSTRIRGLLQGAEEISLNLLTPEEAVNLLRRTANVTVGDTDTAAQAALRKLAELCGFLPLFIQVCAGMLSDYGGSEDWQTELVEALQQDRLGTMEEDADGIAERVVGTSVSTLDDTAKKLFAVMGLCPEDVPVPLVALQVLWSSAGSTEAAPGNGKGKGKGAATRILRRSITRMSDRNLLNGNLGSGIYAHDIVRDYMRNTLGGADVIRAMQRSFIKGVIAAGEKKDTEYDQYIRKALIQHMTEALLPVALADNEV